MRMVDLSGKRFGNLLVTSIADKRCGGHVAWNCLCDCGERKSVRGTHLTQGKISSCGCKALKKISELNKTHGLSKTRTYRIWRNMINRCHYPKYHQRKYYSLRGITVCDRWRKSFENFFEDMGKAPNGLSIDRINNDGNYEPGNCRWATAKVQANNKTHGNKYTFRREINMESMGLV